MDRYLDITLMIQPIVADRGGGLPRISVTSRVKVDYDQGQWHVLPSSTAEHNHGIASADTLHGAVLKWLDQRLAG